MNILALSFQLLLDEHKRLAAEVEIVTSEGETILKRIPANERLTLFFDEHSSHVSIRPKAETA